MSKLNVSIENENLDNLEDLMILLNGFDINKGSCLVCIDCISLTKDDVIDQIKRLLFSSLKEQLEKHVKQFKVEVV